MKKYITLLLLATASTTVVASNPIDVNQIRAAITNNGGVFTCLTGLTKPRVAFNVPDNAPERTERKKGFKKSLPPELQKRVDELNYAKNLYRFNAINKAKQDNGWETMNQEGVSFIEESPYIPPHTYARETVKGKTVFLDKNPDLNNSVFSIIGLNTKKDPVATVISNAARHTALNFFKYSMLKIFK